MRSARLLAGQHRAGVMLPQRALTWPGLQAAYAAMQATPVPERQLDSLQRLLGELCRRGDIATLVQLPLSGKALHSVGSLINTTISLLSAHCVGLRPHAS